MLFACSKQICDYLGYYFKDSLCVGVLTCTGAEARRYPWLGFYSAPEAPVSFPLLGWSPAGFSHPPSTYWDGLTGLRLVQDTWLVMWVLGSELQPSCAICIARAFHHWDLSRPFLVILRGKWYLGSSAWVLVFISLGYCLRPSRESFYEHIHICIDIYVRKTMSLQ